MNGAARSETGIATTAGWDTTNRRPSRQVSIGGVTVGGDAPVRVQSMTTTKTHDAEATLAQIERLAANGCELVRVAVPFDQDAAALPEIARRSPIPVIADNHITWRHAIDALEAGIPGLRVNPGTIGDKKRVKLIADEAKARGVPIRIGVNAGSLDPELLRRYGSPTAEALVESALREAAALEEHGFTDIKLSVKSEDVHMCIEAYRRLAVACDYPLHLGVTEAGPPPQGIVKSAIALGTLLLEGIGDTLRVSLTAPPEEEAGIGWEILKAVGLRRRGVEIVACPSCGRAEVDVFALTRAVQERAGEIPEGMKVAVMGCPVNGPGESRGADVGIAAGVHQGLLFVGGKSVARFSEDRLVDALIDAAREYHAQNGDDR
jgi:(E)-4-hydroxy-3-methylbut-2-enyl-diphosphate synthase